MESAESWKKLLPDLCDNSNRKIMFAHAAFFRKICREDEFSGELPCHNPAAQPIPETFTASARNGKTGRKASCAMDTHPSGSRGKSLWDHSFYEERLDLPSKHE